MWRDEFIKFKLQSHAQIRLFREFCDSSSYWPWTGLVWNSIPLIKIKLSVYEGGGRACVSVWNFQIMNHFMIKCRAAHLSIVWTRSTRMIQVTWFIYSNSSNMVIISKNVSSFAKAFTIRLSSEMIHLERFGSPAPLGSCFLVLKNFEKNFINHLGRS